LADASLLFKRGCAVCKSCGIKRDPSVAAQSSPKRTFDAVVKLRVALWHVRLNVLLGQKPPYVFLKPFHLWPFYVPGERIE